MDNLPNSAQSTTDQINKSEKSDTRSQPTIREAIKAWAKIGILSFGGPAAQIALMHKVIVEEKRWLTEQQYLNALSFCMLLPGPEAMQLATYAGWRLHGIIGGLIAGLLFVLPGALVVLTLSIIYALFGNVPFVEALFFGVKAAVFVIIIEALLRIAKKALHQKSHWLIAGLSFVAIFFLSLPFPLIILAAAIFGYLKTDRNLLSETATLPHKGFRHSVKTLTLWLIIWFTPLLAVMAYFGNNHLLTELGWFFSKLAVVTFGGAYAVLAYMGQDVVELRGWLEAGQMLDGLGLAETTPGPLILVTQFVGFLAAFQHAGGSPLLMGLAGTLIALWATFAPCFLFIFVGAPYIEWIIAQPRLKGALNAIIAAVVGVILNLAIWFALHVFFKTVTKTESGLFTLWQPDLSTIDLSALALACLSAYLLLYRHWPIAATLTASASIALAIKLSGIA